MAQFHSFSCMSSVALNKLKPIGLDCCSGRHIIATGQSVKAREGKSILLILLFLPLLIPLFTSFSDGTVSHSLAGWLTRVPVRLYNGLPT